MFSKKQILTQAWEGTKAHWGLLWGAIIIVMAISWFFAVAQKTVEHHAVATLIVVIVAIVVNVILKVGVVNLTLRLAEGKGGEFTDIFSPYRFAWNFFLASIVYGVAVVVGLILFIVPGIIIAIKYGQYPFVLLDKNVGPFASLKESARLTDGVKWQLFLLGFIFVLLMLVSIIPLGLGLLATIPMGYLLSAYSYTTLRARANGTQDVQVVPEAEPATFVPAQ